MATKKRPPREKTIAAGEFKNRCLRLLDEVARDRTPLIVTKRGKPIVKLLPADEEVTELFGYMRGSIRITGDIVSPLDIEWEAER